jgi:hypothetical protein
MAYLDRSIHDATVMTYRAPSLQNISIDHRQPEIQYVTNVSRHRPGDQII